MEYYSTMKYNPHLKTELPESFGASKSSVPVHWYNSIKFMFGPTKTELKMQRWLPLRDGS